MIIMKLKYPNCIALIFALLIATIQNVTAEIPEQRNAPHERNNDRRATRSYVLDRFMAALEQQDQDEHERLQRLREEDRSEFRRELRRILAEHREKIMAENEDQVHDQSPRSQTALPSRPGHRGRFPEPNPEVAVLSGGLNSLIDQYQSESDEARRSELLGEMRDKLESIFEIREADRKAMIERMEARLEQMKTIMNERQDHKHEILDKQLRQILQDD